MKRPRRLCGRGNAHQFSVACVLRKWFRRQRAPLQVGGAASAFYNRAEVKDAAGVCSPGDAPGERPFSGGLLRLFFECLPPQRQSSRPPWTRTSPSRAPAPHFPFYGRPIEKSFLARLPGRSGSRLIRAFPILIAKLTAGARNSEPPDFLRSVLVRPLIWMLKRPPTHLRVSRIEIVKKFSSRRGLKGHRKRDPSRTFWKCCRLVSDRRFFKLAWDQH